MRIRKPTPAGQTRLPRVHGAAGTQVAAATAIRAQLKQCQDDAAGAREASSWSALNSFSRLERQLWIDLHAAEQVEARDAAAEAARSESSVDDEVIFADVVAGILALPPTLRQRLTAALGGAASRPSDLLRHAGGRQ